MRHSIYHGRAEVTHSSLEAHCVSLQVCPLDGELTASRIAHVLSSRYAIYQALFIKSTTAAGAWVTLISFTHTLGL